MAMIVFLGGEETGNPAFCQWGRFKFVYGQPVECDDPHIVAKAQANRFFRVDGEAPKPDPFAKARAAKAAKRVATAKPDEDD